MESPSYFIFDNLILLLMKSDIPIEKLIQKRFKVQNNEIK